MRLDGAAIVLDTNILLHLLRGRPHGQLIADAYGLNVRRPRPVIPVVVAGEIRSFARQRGWEVGKLTALDSLLAATPMADISSAAVIRAYADLDSLSTSAGRSMSKNDAWIAAITRVAAATLLTTDKDFDHLNGTTIAVEYIDPEQLKLGVI